MSDKWSSCMSDKMVKLYARQDGQAGCIVVKQNFRFFWWSSYMLTPVRKMCIMDTSVPSSIFDQAFMLATYSSFM